SLSDGRGVKSEGKIWLFAFPHAALPGNIRSFLGINSSKRLKSHNQNNLYFSTPGVDRKVRSSRKSFAQNHYIWTDFFMVYSQPPAGPRQACLHLISNPQTRCPVSV
uniref:Uncharacterized protein n=1 Tax=Labrus bergylta TaxID=56723 RepID=A0A3Q3GK56_9LABR